MDENEEDEYVWRFRLDECSIDDVYKNPFAEMIRIQIEQMLNVVRFTKDEEVVSIDGFLMLYEPEKIYKLFKQNYSD